MILEACFPNTVCSVDDLNKDSDATRLSSEERSYARVVTVTYRPLLALHKLITPLLIQTFPLLLTDLSGKTSTST